MVKSASWESQARGGGSGVRLAARIARGGWGGERAARRSGARLAARMARGAFQKTRPRIFRIRGLMSGG